MNKPRVDYTRHSPETFQGLVKLSTHLHHGALGPGLIQLIHHRASQINGCAFCVDMHGTALRRAGIDARKLDTLAAWQDSPFFDARERAALNWAEALMRMASSRVDDDVYEDLTAHFDEREISELTFAVAVIKAWNTLSVGLRRELPGD